MKSKSYKRQIAEYNEKYGHIPLDHDDILNYIIDNWNLTEKDMQMIQEEEDAVASIPWKELKIILPIIPHPSPRPRYHRASDSFYVTGAAENRKLFKYYLKEKYDIIYTQTHFYMDAYLPTPVSSLSKREIYRAENKSVIPTTNPDFDNLLKTYSDMIQKILILNDNIISVGIARKYYSLKPRVEIIIEYQMGYDSKYNKRRTESTTAFRTAVETGGIINIYTDGEEWWL